VVGSVNDTADWWWAVSMTPLTRMVDLELFDWIQIHTPKNLVSDPAYANYANFVQKLSGVNDTADQCK
jgi:hypothetical protein